MNKIISVLCLFLIMGVIFAAGCLGSNDRTSNHSIFSQINASDSEIFAYSGEVTDISADGNLTHITVQNDFTIYNQPAIMNFILDENVLNNSDIPEYKLEIGKSVFICYKQNEDISGSAIVTGGTVFRERTNISLYNGTVVKINPKDGTDNDSKILLKQSDNQLTYFSYSTGTYFSENIKIGMKVTVCGDPFRFLSKPAQGWAYAV